MLSLAEAPPLAPPVSALLCKGAGCVSVGSDFVATLGGPESGTWQRGNDINAPGGYFYRDYFLIVPPHTQFDLHVDGDECGGPYTVNDPYIWVFELDGTPWNADDDGGCGFNSEMDFENNTGFSFVVAGRSRPNQIGNSGQLCPTVQANLIRHLVPQGNFGRWHGFIKLLGVVRGHQAIGKGITEGAPHRSVFFIRDQQAMCGRELIQYAARFIKA